MDEAKFANRIDLVGTILDDPTFSHKGGEREMYAFRLSVRRLSGTPDILNIILDKRLLGDAAFKAGDHVKVSGHINTRNEPKPAEGSPRKKHSRVVVTVLAKRLEHAGDEPDSNVASVSGILCKKQVLRVTPLSGSTILDFVVRVDSAHKSVYIPTIAWGSTARDVNDLPIGHAVTVDGRLQSREYDKPMPDGTAETRTAYELSTWNVSARPT